MSALPDYEKLASFYLGKKYDLAEGQLLDEKVLYDAKDLTTHAMCVGMTGSGKTGLCIALLEEAALDGIPAICVDPKGDLGNLLLAFPDQNPSDFQKWIDPAEASRKGLELEEYATQTAIAWKQGLESWDQDEQRVQRFKDSVEITIYTPGSQAGIPISVLRSFDAPPAAVLEDNDVFRERVVGAASGLLTLLGIEADPVSSREHILLANILTHTWRSGSDLDLPTLIRAIQNPPIDKIGVFDIESFFPAQDRMKLSMALNNLLASPTFSGWLEGQPLDVKRLLYTEHGKPRLSIISIAHLSDAERMFFVTVLLNELLGWMRCQPGTSSLRALFYMDEVFGYFPPTAKPPSKPPMMILLKQARAFGLGIVLATQNPVDLDYKGLSNIGTWFLGRLQTQRDKDRVLEGLEGAAVQSKSGFDRGAMEQTLAALGNRVFLMNNVHDEQPTIFQTRWVMSYLRGPLSRQQIQELMDSRRAELTSSADQDDAPQQDAERMSTGDARPVLPHGIEERFAVATRPPSNEGRIVYQPCVFAHVSCHYVRISAGLDVWLDRALLFQCNKQCEQRVPRDIWDSSLLISSGSMELSKHPESGYAFAELPAEMMNPKQYKRWEKELRDYLYRHQPITLYECKELKRFSKPGQDESDARVSWKQELRELRDAQCQELRAKYAKKVDSLEDKIRTAKQRLEREQAQYDQQKWTSVFNIGQTVLGAFLGRKVSSRSATTGRSIGRAAQQRTDVLHAEESLAELLQDKLELEKEFERDVNELRAKFDVEAVTLEPLSIPCRKGDLVVNMLALIWAPWQMNEYGKATSLVNIQHAK